MQFLLYGANGYTGTLIAELAQQYGLTPILAGRSEHAVKALADRLGYAYRVFPLDHQEALYNALAEVPVVLHAAGPFKHTAQPMMEACLKTGTHYLDITGEIDIFELGASLDQQAQAKGILLMPGTGFDVVPTDSLALHLKNTLPDATSLQLAFAASGGGMSHGSANTMVESLGALGAVRKDGKIVAVPVGHKTLMVPFNEKKWMVMTIPWGDVSTAYYTTGIPNIEVYVGVSPYAYKNFRRMRFISGLLKTNFIRNIIRNQIKKRPSGPTDAQRDASQCFIWGRVENAAGQVRTARMITPNGYTLTAQTSLAITQKVLTQKVPVGFQTPAKVFGTDLILGVEGVKLEELVNA